MSVSDFDLFFFKQKTAYEMRISDWSSDVCSSDLGRHRWAAVVLGFAGVLIVVQPGSGAFPLSGALVGLLAALLVAVIAILLRQIGRTEPAATTAFWFSALSLPPLGIVYLFNLQPHDPATWAVLVGIGQIGRASWRERGCQYGE